MSSKIEHMKILLVHSMIVQPFSYNAYTVTLKAKLPLIWAVDFVNAGHKSHSNLYSDNTFAMKYISSSTKTIFIYQWYNTAIYSRSSTYISYKLKV